MIYAKILWKMWTTAPWRESLASTIYGAALIVKNFPSKKTSPVRDARLVRCHNCHVYDSGFKTCGTPGRMKDNRPFGCWCYLPMAAGIPDKECWLGANGGPDMWNGIN